MKENDHPKLLEEIYKHAKERRVHSSRSTNTFIDNRIYHVISNTKGTMELTAQNSTKELAKKIALGYSKQLEELQQEGDKMSSGQQGK